MEENRRFPENFVWGAASSAYQAEGAYRADGKGLSVWDVYTHEPGHIFNGDTGDVACDQYEKFDTDLKIMKELGLQAYRFSINWPRVIPDGCGQVNEKGLDFYDQMVERLLENDIIPYITLFHWELPYGLYLKGGWLNRDIVQYFAEYVSVVIRRLSDRVRFWITENEPQCYIGAALHGGGHAPGLKVGEKDIFLAAHHSLLAHGSAVEVIRETAKTASVIGYAPASWHLWSPVSDSPEDIEACRRETFRAGDDPVGATSWWLDPVILGRYPETAGYPYEKYLPEIRPEDMKMISQPIDFIGMNVYQTYRGKADGEGNCVTVKALPGAAQTNAGWPVTPEALYWGPRFYWERYHKKLYITENGLSNQDWVSLDGKVHDPQRIDFLRRYLRKLREAVREGIPVEGYFHWALTDNFEWASGYSNRFGLVYTDFASQERIIKDSGQWYSRVISSNGEII